MRGIWPCVKVAMWQSSKVSWFGDRCHGEYLLGSLESISSKSINLAMIEKKHTEALN